MKWLRVVINEKGCVHYSTIQGIKCVYFDDKNRQFRWSLLVVHFVTRHRHSRMDSKWGMCVHNGYVPSTESKTPMAQTNMQSYKPDTFHKVKEIMYMQHDPQTMWSKLNTLVNHFKSSLDLVETITYCMRHLCKHTNSCGAVETVLVW